jgi:hypothetical protein
VIEPPEVVECGGVDSECLLDIGLSADEDEMGRRWDSVQSRAEECEVGVVDELGVTPGLLGRPGEWG